VQSAKFTYGDKDLNYKKQEHIQVLAKEAYHTPTSPTTKRIFSWTTNQYASPLRGNAIPAGPLSDFLSYFYKIRHGGGRPWSIYSRQATHDHHHTGMIIEEVHPIFAPPNIF